MEKSQLRKTAKIISLDISTKCIGFALFEMKDMKLLELTHFSPKIIPEPEDKIELLLKKADSFKKKLLEYQDVGVVAFIIEEPLINSNNVYTVQTLLRFNSFITKIIYDAFGITPEFLSTYESRKWAFPELVQPNAKGHKVLFGDYPKDCDKKAIIWECVSKLEPQVEWLYTKNNTLKKENFDMSDAYTVGLAWRNKNKAGE